MTRRFRSKVNNKGLTLVELLIAMTILVLIVVPLLHVMISSARVSLKTRRQLRVTTAAQDIMEGLKAESLETLAIAFNYPNKDDSAGDFDNFKIIRSNLIDHGNYLKLYELRATIEEDPASANYREATISENVTRVVYDPDDPTGPARDDSASVSIRDDGVNYDLYDKSDHKYYFAIQDMNIEDETGAPLYVVDALIELNGYDYTEDQTDTARRKATTDYSTQLGSHFVSGTEYALLNENGISDFSEINPKRAAFAIQSEDELLKVVDEFNSTYSPSVNVTAADVAQEITIETVESTSSYCRVKKTKPDGTEELIPVTTVNCSIRYYTDDTGSFTLKAGDPGYVAGTAAPYEKTINYSPHIFSNENTGYDLDAVYLLYHPNYGSWKKDKIIYVCEKPKGADLYIVKQEPENNGSLNVDEMNYKCDVVMNEGAGAAIGSYGTLSRTDNASTKVMTNLDRNLYKTYVSSAADVLQGIYKYNGSSLTRSYDSSGKFNNPDATRIYDLWGPEDSSDRMFDVTIDIYEEGTLAPIISAGSGTITNDKILFTLTGSMN